MPDKLPFMPLYGRDFFGDEAVLLMSDRQQAWYLRLLWHQWEHESIPDESITWCAIVKPETGPSDPEWDRFTESTIPRLFPKRNDGRRANKKLDDVRTRQWALHKQRKEAGRLGAEARYGQQDSSKAIAAPKRKDSIQIKNKITDTTYPSNDEQKKPWNNIAGPALRQAGVTKSEHGDAMKWWKEARAEHSDAELELAVRWQARVFAGKPWNPAALWNVRNAEQSTKLRRVVGECLKRQAASPIAKAVSAGIPLSGS